MIFVDENRQKMFRILRIFVLVEIMTYMQKQGGFEIKSGQIKCRNCG